VDEDMNNIEVEAVEQPAENNDETNNEKNAEKKNEINNVEVFTSTDFKGYTPVKKKKNGKRWLIILLLLLVIAMLGAAVWYVTKGGDVDMTEGSIVTQINYELSAKADFYTNDGNIFFATKDGIKMLDGKGKDKWSETYTMLSPVLIGDENIVAVAEKNGNAIRVYNENGALYNVSFNDPVVTYSINGTGYMGAITSSDSSYELTVYDNSGQLLFKGSYAADDGIPTAMDISDDGKMFAVSFININSINMQSNVLFYYINKSDVQSVDSSDGMFTSLVREGSLAVGITFTSNNRCIVVMDDRLDFVDTSVGADQGTAEVTLGNRITSACVNGDGTIAVALGEPVLNAEVQSEENTVVWYSAAGAKLSEYQPDKTVTGLFAGEETTVIAMDRAFEAYKPKGQSVWKYTALQDTARVLPYDGDSKLIAVTSGKAIVAKVGKGNNLIEVLEGSQQGDSNVSGAEDDSEELTELATVGEAVTAAASEAEGEPVTEAAASPDNNEQQTQAAEGE
jgi:hypothetical protein